MNAFYNLTVEQEPKPEDISFLQGQLTEFNQAHRNHDRYQPLAIVLRDVENNIVGGMTGGTYCDWLYVDTLWVKESIRRPGYGRALLAAAEQEAVQRGCKDAFLDTFSFQAPDFYQSQGYIVFGKLNDASSGQTRYFMRKSFFKTNGE
ncbi:MAG: GNAT family N-acetyltransferase [Cyanobacteriota bacterium]|nr:GNAT family N-acetyltransferase [Cyanobacteriota bacterium]